MHEAEDMKCHMSMKQRTWIPPIGAHHGYDPNIGQFVGPIDKWVAFEPILKALARPDWCKTKGLTDELAQ